MSNLRHLMNYDNSSATATATAATTNYMNIRKKASISNLIDATDDVPSSSSASSCAHGYPDEDQQSRSLPNYKYNQYNQSKPPPAATRHGKQHGRKDEHDEVEEEEELEELEDSEDQQSPSANNNNNDNKNLSSSLHKMSNHISQEQILSSFEKIKTHFPAARIKKIMQSDEEIGKVAQATPIIVGRALEIFMANLVEVSILQAKKQGVKRITASHVKSAIENTEQFDFLVEAVEKYPSLKS
ncbi:uncharacterized protein LODBEIA_P48330 [Lodderomyces beijingensis]|uniref:Transcription factor CBF/NF-Y/archaeal histone domain-containing protein n=1 Tax=Lodderomyces beijingensis TaxID=1775926 RepID=A0ABP0ZRS1_9ASCO